MADPRFFKKPSAVSAQALAEIIGAEIKSGDCQHLISDVASLSQASERDVSFLENDKYLPELKTGSAGAVILPPDKIKDAPQGTVCLAVSQPYQGFARAAQFLYPEATLCEPVSGIQHRAVHPDARLEENIEIGIGAVIGSHVEIGAGTKIAANVVVGAGCVIGRNCRIGANSTLSHALIGDRVIIHPQASIGQDGFGFVPQAPAHIKIPQLGRVIIQNDVEIGAGSMIDRGALSDTIVAEGSKLDNQCHLAHNVQIGRHCLMAAQSGIAGSAKLGDHVMIGGKAGIVGHITIGNNVTIHGATVVMKDLPDGAQVSGYPARDVSIWRRQHAALSRLVKAKSGKKS